MSGSDAEATALSLEQLGHYDAFVMGRVTYEKFYATWGHTTGNPYIDRINAVPTYVASRSLTQTAWNATLAFVLIRRTRKADALAGWSRTGARARR